MVSNPEQWVEPLAAAGANSFIFHLEATEDPEKLIDAIRATKMKVGPGLDRGALLKALLHNFLFSLIRISLISPRPTSLSPQVGIVIKPKTDVKDVMPFGDKVDQILIMTVEPGFGGQQFMTDMMPKVRSCPEVWTATSPIQRMSVPDRPVVPPRLKKRCGRCASPSRTSTLRWTGVSARPPSTRQQQQAPT
jgi:pentose-5-phosphate-3-epimerase